MARLALWQAAERGNLTTREQTMTGESGRSGRIGDSSGELSYDGDAAGLTA